MAALHTLFAIFFAFGLVQLGKTYGTEEPFTRSQEGVQCYDEDFDIIHCDWGCVSTRQNWEGENLENKPSGCIMNYHELGLIGQVGSKKAERKDLLIDQTCFSYIHSGSLQCVEDPGGLFCFCNEHLCNNSMKNKSWWITLALAFCLFKLFG